MFSKVISASLFGLDNYLVNIETKVFEKGLPSLTIVGLPDKAVGEAKERILSALDNSGLALPKHRCVINLAPANLPKEGTFFDLGMALGILASELQLNPNSLDGALFVGELSLSGNITAIKGALPIAVLAKQNKLDLYLPIDNLAETSLVTAIPIYPVKSLRQLFLHLNGTQPITPVINQSKITLPLQNYSYDFADILQQNTAKRALEVAASGFHNVLLSGPPGTGKTLLARAFPSILPMLTNEEIMETTKIYSISGLLTKNRPLIFYPPFRAPHHTISRNGLIGGGSKPMPGEISLAHRGVLFLDEMAEFPRSVLEAVRQPLEDGQVLIARAAGSAVYPARFILLGATNPCPCGNLGNPQKNCLCSPNQIMRYKKRLSGPVLDRIDLHIFVPFLSSEKLTASNYVAEESRLVRKRVVAARKIQQVRFAKQTFKTNGEMSVKEIKKFCRLTAAAQNVLKKAIDKHNLSIRSYFKIIKVAQTVCDLGQKEIIDAAQIAEALQYRINE